jgi:hypothetical protein
MRQQFKATLVFSLACLNTTHIATFFSPSGTTAQRRRRAWLRWTKARGGKWMRNESIDFRGPPLGFGFATEKKFEKITFSSETCREGSFGIPF